MNAKEHSESKNALVDKLVKRIDTINKQVIFPGEGVDEAIATDLAEIYVALEKYRGTIDKFIAADVQNREIMEAALVEIESTLKNIESYAKNVHAFFDRMKTFYCWK